MPHNRTKPLLIAVVISVQTTVTLAPAFAQESTGYTSDLIDVSDIYDPAANEVPTAQVPGGILGTVFDLFGDKQKEGQARTINQTQQKLLKVYDYGQKALNAYRLGSEIYKGLSKIIKDPDGILKDGLTAILDDYNKIGNDTIASADSGGNGPSSKVFKEPNTPAESYIQAKNDVARRMYLPSLMQQLVFGEDARDLREQQSEQLEESLTNTIEASENLVKISGGASEATAANGDLAKALGEESANAQGLKSSQAVLKSLAAGQGIRAQQSAAEGVILGSIQQSQVEQNKSTTALVVSSTLAYQQRDVQNHQLASQSVFLEQIRADLGQQEDERQRAAFTKANRQANFTSNVMVPGLLPTTPPAD